jgi:3-dehydroquinate dehydratase-1
MICVAISDKNIDSCLQILNSVELAEIRIDLTGFGPEEIRAVCNHRTPVIATCRGDATEPEKQLELLTTAVRSGAAYVDIEIEAGKEQIDLIAELARKHGCKLIISYHNFEETPGLRELYKKTDACFDLGGDIAKIVTMARSEADCARILSLYSIEKPIVALCMGEAGKLTRIMAPLLGAEFTFAAPDDGKGTAPGQIEYSRMKEIMGCLEKEIPLKSR